jgi:hypothetical protein
MARSVARRAKGRAAVVRPAPSSHKLLVREAAPDPRSRARCAGGAWVARIIAWAGVGAGGGAQGGVVFRVCGEIRPVIYNSIEESG